MTSRASAWSARIGAVALAAFALGPLAVQLGGASPFLGFRVFGVGVLLGLVALVLGAVGIFRTRAGRRAGRSQALAGFAIGAALVAAAVAAAGGGRSVPPINDVTTDLADPPAFVRLATLDANRGRDLSHPGEPVADAQRRAYPDLAPIRLPVAPAQALRRVEDAAAELGWNVVAVDEAAGRVEATDTSRIFRFVDDVVVRVRPAAGDSVVDVRSKSRDGRSDLGVNAARIRALRDALSDSPPAP